jgi:diguanylate cyclase (GGDEF)-like protein/hemerythrin-like metal-binding protein
MHSGSAMHLGYEAGGVKERADAVNRNETLGTTVLEALDGGHDPVGRGCPLAGGRRASALLEIAAPRCRTASAEILELRARLADLERAATTDKLTGAWNRRYLDQAIETEIARSRRHGQPLSAVLVDIDHFKRVNDTQGHAAGDAVLVAMVVRLRAHKRATDLLTRWGGEEFLILMPGTGQGEAASAAERLRAAVQARKFIVGPLTVSAGVAELAAAEDSAAFFARLDRLLYEAKRGGRNRVAADPRAVAEALRRARGGFLHLTWREAFESGNAAVDAEHRELFDLANHLVASTLSGGVDSGATAAALATLMDAVTRHFAHEEEILAQSGYPDLARHRAAHATLLAQAAELRRRATLGEARLGELVEFIALDLVARHLLRDDREFFPFVLG